MNITPISVFAVGDYNTTAGAAPFDRGGSLLPQMVYGVCTSLVGNKLIFCRLPVCYHYYRKDVVIPKLPWQRDPYTELMGTLRELPV